MYLPCAPHSSWALAVAAMLSIIIPSNALYFYMDGQTPKCFLEELPKDTLVVGHFSADAFHQTSKSYLPSTHVGIHITVEEMFDNDHRVVNQKAAGTGRFTFTAADSGDHRICFMASGAPPGGWLSNGSPNGQGGVRFTLDMAIGETSQLENTDKNQVQGMAAKVKDLNARLQDIRREQVFQREREAEFRDQSEQTNARVVRWTLIQLVVLGITCAWQLSHLRNFFIKQKLT